MDESNNNGLSDSAILIVDDNPENLRVLREMLCNQGCVVRIARDGQSALRSVEASPPDLILLDIHMPGMDGYEVCRRLKADPQFQDIPVIFLSALGETFNKIAAYQCGGVDYITKPFQFEEVQIRMQSHLKSRRLLAETQAGFRSSFEQAAVGMAHLSLDGTFFRVNRKFCQMLKYDADELLGQSLLNITAEDFREISQAELHRVATEEPEGVSAEEQLLTKDGKHIWCRITLSPVTVASTNEKYLAVIVVDISERKRFEGERDQLAAAIEQAAEAFVITDAKGTVSYVNPTWQRVSGRNREQSIGQKLWDFLGGSSRGPTPHAMRDTLESGESWHGQLRLHTADGDTCTLDVTASPVRDAKGEIVHFVTVARDISDQLTLEDRLRQAQKLEAIGTLAGGIAHDFNNILSAIMGYTDLAMCDLPREGEIYQNLEQVLHASNVARDLVAQILAFSRQTDRETKPVLIQSIVKESLKLLRGSIPSTIEIRDSIDSNCAPVIADPTSVHQIIMNLCTNAYQAMQEKGGVLAVQLSQFEVGDEEVASDPNLSRGCYLRLDVQDTGCGMDERIRARIFEPYFTTKERGEGTGLGLATIHGIVKDLNGTIHVYSEPEEGSTFTVLLPCAPRDTAPKTTPASIEPLQGTERVLIVDDEIPVGEFAKAALERMGYQVTVENSSVAALERFVKDPNAFDIVVTDQMMPNMKGLELSQKIRDIRGDIPIILCSGFSETMCGISSETKSIQRHVMKPIIGADLARAIREVVR